MEEITKVCNKCGVRKALDKFQKQERGLYGRRSDCTECRNKYRRERRNAHPELAQKHREKNLAYYYDNKERVLERVKEYAHRPDVRPKVLEQAKQRWHKRSQKERDEYNEKRLDEYHARYGTDEEYTEKRKQTQRHNAKIQKFKRRGAPGSHTRREWEELKKKQGYKCLRCGEVKQLSRDHVIPIEKGGSSDISNIQGLCRSCNSKKHTKTIDYRK